MLVEMRIYTYLPGKLHQMLPIIEKEVLPIQQRHLGRLVGYYVAETGTLNQATQMWAFEDAGDRERRRAALAADPQWQALLSRFIDVLQTQETRLLKPTSFSPVR